MKKLFLSVALYCLQSLGYSQELTDTTFIAVDSVFAGRIEAAGLLPNIIGKSMMTPTAWGGYGTFIFGSIGGSFPQVYSNNPDLIASAGIGTGNSITAVSVVGILNMNDVSAINNYTLDFIVSRSISFGNSISAGAIHLFSDPVKTDIGPSYYIAFSHASQTLPSTISGCSKLNYTLGIGSGRFFNKSEVDVQFGRGRRGTAVFANIAYEILPKVNVGVEWTGLNLCSSLSWRPYYNLPSICLGVADLTRFSGDKPRLIAGISYAYLINKTVR